MTNESANSGRPPSVDRTTFQAELDKLRAREKAHTRQGDAIAAARRRLPMTEADASACCSRRRTSCCPPRPPGARTRPRPRPAVRGPSARGSSAKSRTLRRCWRSPA